MYDSRGSPKLHVYDNPPPPPPLEALHITLLLLYIPIFAR